jgi:hypothetical protein
VHRVGSVLAHDKKSSWPPLPFYEGAYNFKCIKEAIVEEKNMATFHFGEEISRRHNPLDVVS